MRKIGIVLICMLIYACGGNRTSSEDHLHEGDQDETSTLQFTLFTGSAEFFIEHHELHMGMEAEFLVHITMLDTYKPLSSGYLEMSLGAVRIQLKEPVRPGIFLVHLTPKAEGEYAIKCSLRTDSLSEAVSWKVTVHRRLADEDRNDRRVAGEGKQDKREDHDHEHSHAGSDHQVSGGNVEAGNVMERSGDASIQEKEHEDRESPEMGSEVDLSPEGEINFLKEMAWETDFMVRQIMPGPFVMSVRTGGEILSMPGEKKMVASSADGIIIFSRNDLVQGSQVQKGELLFTIRGISFVEGNAGMKFQQYRIDLEKSRQAYERHRKLFAERVIPEKEFMESRARYLSDSLRFYNLASSASEEGLKVLAPESGYIHELNVSEGQFVETGQLLVTVSANRVLLLRADLPQQFYYLLDRIHTASFRTAYGDRFYQIEELNGRLIAKGASVAENDHYMPVYFEVINNGSLLEGAFAEFRLQTGQKENVISVPATALLEELGSYYLFVQVTGESFTRRPVTIGENNGAFVEILSGLEVGERVVTEGVMILKSASIVSGTDSHQHSH